MADLTLVGLIFLLVGLVMGGAAIQFTVRQRAFVRRAKRASGVVVDVVLQSRRSRKGRRSTYQYPVVRFEIPDRDAIEFTSRVGTNPSRYREGQEVSVLYDPDDPTQAELDSGLALWFISVMFGLVGVVFTGVGVIALVVSLRSGGFAFSLYGAVAELAGALRR